MSGRTTRANPKLRKIADNYRERVELDSRKHPIQQASVCIPSNIAGTDYCNTAEHLYNYTACAYYEDGSPMMNNAPVELARWLIMDNVYVREDPLYPSHPGQALARSVGFSDEG